MLKARVLRRLVGTNALNFRRTYLSQEYKTVMEKKLELPHLDRNMKRILGQSEEVALFEIDTFINKCHNEDRRGEIYEQLLKLRLSAAASASSSDSISHAVINYLVPLNVDDLLSILSNRLQYGVFIDSFQGCYLMDLLLSKNNFVGAVQIAAELMVQDDCDHQLVQALALKSCFEYLTKSLDKLFEVKNHTAETESDKSEKPTKVRVKFLRNPPETELIDSKTVNAALLSEVIHKFSSRCSKKEVQQNGQLLAYILANQLNEVENLLKSYSDVFCKDVAEVSLSMLEHSLKADEILINSVKNALSQVTKTSKKSYNQCIDRLLKEATEQSEASLIQEREDSYLQWTKDREEQINNVMKNQTRTLRRSEIETAVATLENTKQKLWFFEKQDQLDLAIFKKVVRYPKRWFGKKKKPRTVDDNYVPPEIRVK